MNPISLAFTLLIALLPITQGMTPAPTDPIAWVCDGPEPVDPNPRLVDMPLTTSAGSFFGIRATVENCGAGALTGLAYAIRIESTGDSALVVPSDSLFLATDGNGGALAPGSFASAMVLHPLTPDGQSLPPAGSLTISLPGKAGGATGSAIVYFGLGDDLARVTFTASNSMRIE